MLVGAALVLYSISIGSGKYCCFYKVLELAIHHKAADTNSNTRCENAVDQ